MNFIYNKHFKNFYFPISAVIMSILTGVLTSVICSDGIFTHSNLFSILIIMIILLLTSDILLTIAYAKREENLEEKQCEINTQKDLIEKQKKEFLYLLETFRKRPQRRSTALLTAPTISRDNASARPPICSPREIISTARTTAAHTLCLLCKANRLRLTLCIFTE